MFTINEAGDVRLVPWAFMFDDGQWVELPDDALPALNLLGETDPEACVGKVIELSAAPVIGAVELQPRVLVVGLA